MHSCKTIGLWASMRNDTSIGPMKTLAIYFHIMMCTPCRRFMVNTQNLRWYSRAFTQQADELKQEPETHAGSSKN